MDDDALTSMNGNDDRLTSLGEALDATTDAARARQTGRQRLMAKIEKDQIGTRASHSRTPGTRARRLAVIGAAAVVAVSLLIVPTLLPGKGGGPIALGPLSIAQASAVSRPATELSPGDYWYTKTTGTKEQVGIAGDSLSWTVRSPFTTELWVAPDGSGLDVTSLDTPSFATEDDRRAWIEAGRLPLPEAGTSRTEYAPGALTARDFSLLPSGTVELKSTIESREVVGGPPGDTETLRLIADLLREPTVTPAVRASLYDVAGSLPAVVVEDDQTDSLGRPGASLTMEVDNSGLQILFDPESSDLLEIRQWDGPAAADQRSTIYLDSGVTADPGTRP